MSVNKCNSKITPTFIQSCYRLLRRILCSCSFEYELVTSDLERSNQILHFLVMHLVLRKHFQSCTYPIQSCDHQHGHRAAYTMAEILVKRKFHCADVQPISNRYQSSAVWFLIGFKLFFKTSSTTSVLINVIHVRRQFLPPLVFNSLLSGSVKCLWHTLQSKLFVYFINITLITVFRKQSMLSVH